MSNKFYIYNIEQAHFYISEGVKPLRKPEVNPKTGKIFYVFDREESQAAYELWVKK